MLIIFYYKEGYTYVCLSKEGKVKKFRIHRLVASHFIDNPHYYDQVNHINAIRDHNNVENLEWCTVSDNMKHKFKIGNQSNANGNNAMAKSVINTITGEIFGTIKQAAQSVEMSKDALYSKLRGNRINDTVFRYLLPEVSVAP